MKWVVYWFVLLLRLNAAHAVELKILTDDGFVAFSPGADWPIVATQTHLPVAVMAFQVPNASDVGSPDSTNLSISLYSLGTDRGRNAFAKMGTPLGLKPPSIEVVGSWSIYRQEALQAETMYTILDAKRSEVADVAVAVRLAWPHLSSNPKNYNEDMEALFRGFLSSIYGTKGPYKPKDGEVIRRPES